MELRHQIINLWNYVQSRLYVEFRYDSSGNLVLDNWNHCGLILPMVWRSTVGEDSLGIWNNGFDCTNYAGDWPEQFYQNFNPGSIWWACCYLWFNHRLKKTIRLFFEYNFLFVFANNSEILALSSVYSIFASLHSAYQIRKPRKDT